MESLLKVIYKNYDYMLLPPFPESSTQHLKDGGLSFSKGLGFATGRAQQHTQLMGFHLFRHCS